MQSDKETGEELSKRMRVNLEMSKPILGWVVLGGGGASGSVTESLPEGFSISLRAAAARTGILFVQGNVYGCVSV